MIQQVSMKDAKLIIRIGGHKLERLNQQAKFEQSSTSELVRRLIDTYLDTVSLQKTMARQLMMERRATK